MSAEAGDVPGDDFDRGRTAPAAGLDGLSEAHGRRWHGLDRLLPVPGALSAGCGATFAVAGPDGRLAAAGTCTHWEGEPGSLELTWGAARRFRLTVQITGPAIGPALSELLTQWHQHLHSLPEAAAEDTAAEVDWPSRDIDGVASLLRHGFAPLAVIAARAGSGPAATGPARTVPAASGPSESRAADSGLPPGVRLRRARPADLDAVVELGLQVVSYDAHFGGVNERSFTPDALKRGSAVLLADPLPWVWLAERDGLPVGLMEMESPEHARWISPMTSATSVAYVLLAGVRENERASGIGAALARVAAAEAAANLVPVTLLHYAQLNPLSAPFWSQQGYRPLWVCWEARPAAAVR